MNKRQIIASLNNIANSLDNSGLNREADIVTNVMVKLAEKETESYGKEPAKKIIDDFVDQAKRNERYDPSLLKMMNDRLEFNGHETMSEEKFKKMIGKKKEANSTNVIKRLAQSLNLADPEFEKKSIIQSIPYNAISNVIREVAIFVVQALGHEDIPHDVWYALAQMVDRGMSGFQFDFGVNDQKLQPAMQKAENTLNEFLKTELGPVPKNDEAYEFWKERSRLYRAAIVKVLMEQSKLYTKTTFEQAANNAKDKYDVSPLKETVNQLDTKEYNPGNKNSNE